MAELCCVRLKQWRVLTPVELKLRGEIMRSAVTATRLRQPRSYRVKIAKPNPGCASMFRVGERDISVSNAVRRCYLSGPRSRENACCLTERKVLDAANKAGIPVVAYLADQTDYNDTLDLAKLLATRST